MIIMSNILVYHVSDMSLVLQLLSHKPKILDKFKILPGFGLDKKLRSHQSDSNSSWGGYKSVPNSTVVKTS